MSTESLYDRIARLYDPWSVSVREDVELYVEEALASGGPVVELAVGTGRIAVPIAKAGVSVIGVDQSAGMLAVAQEYAAQEGVAGLLDLRVGDLRDPPVDERVPLVTIPFRYGFELDSLDDFDHSWIRAAEGAAPAEAPLASAARCVRAAVEPLASAEGRRIGEETRWEVAVTFTVAPVR